jgi:hypothetical protein
MAYIANRVLLVIPKGTDQRIQYKPGDIIPDFESWPEVPRRAHLNMNYVIKDDSIVAPKVAKIAQKVTKSKAKKVAQVEEAPQATAEPADKLGVAAADVGDDENLFGCTKCPGKSFATARALSTHITLAHRKG